MLLTTEQLFHSKNVGLFVLAGTPPLVEDSGGAS